MPCVPGEVIFLPPNAVLLDPKWRPWLLLNQSPPRRYISLCYGSTQSTELDHGAAAFSGDPVVIDGVTCDSYYYPGIIWSMDVDGLPNAVQIQPHYAAAAWNQLPNALGIGSQTWESAVGVADGSMRGRLVQVNSRVAASLQSSVGVLVTEHLYSVARRYQVFIPLYTRPLRPGIRGRALDDPSLPWVQAVLPGASRVIAGVGLVVSLADQSLDTCQIEHVFDETIDVASLHLIENALMAHLTTWA